MTNGHCGNAIKPNACYLNSNAIFTSYEQVVDAYIRDIRPHSRHELNFDKGIRDEDRRLEFIALCRCEGDKRHDHERRIHNDSLNIWKEKILSKKIELNSLKSFYEIHSLLNKISNEINGIGELTTYDTAFRIGAVRNIYPEKIYLHAGTRVGARTIGIKTNRVYLDISELPLAFKKLDIHEVEDCLCIYKDCFNSTWKKK